MSTCGTFNCCFATSLRKNFKEIEEESRLVQEFALLWALYKTSQISLLCNPLQTRVCLSFSLKYLN